MNLVTILEGAHVALGVLQARLVLLVALLMTFALFCWAMWLQTKPGLIVAAMWGIIVFLPVLFARPRSSDGHEAPPVNTGQSE
jgi:hypothetical protein